MKSKEEIEQRLQEASSQMEDIQSWHKKAMDRYQDNKKFFGEADRGEMDQAGDDLREIRKEVNILKWVLQ